MPIVAAMHAKPSRDPSQGRIVVNGLDRWTVEMWMWSANKKSLESSESQREDFVFS